MGKHPLMIGVVIKIKLIIVSFVRPLHSPSNLFMEAREVGRDRCVES